MFLHNNNPSKMLFYKPAELRRSLGRSEDFKLFRLPFPSATAHNFHGDSIAPSEHNNTITKTFKMTNRKIIQQEENFLRSSDKDLQEEATLQPRQVEMANREDSSEAPVRSTFRFVPLRMRGNGGTHKPSSASASLIDEVPLEKLKDMTERFYEKAFQDDTLDKFIRSHDDPHGTRFAKWIHQKLSGSQVWDDDRQARGRHCPVHDRTSAHVAAWYSPKRPAQERGRHFELDECRVWMRLHFWAMRESGLIEYSPSFADYYVRFIGHFVRVYESTAPMFARDSLRWSADAYNIQKYLDNGRKMKDVLGLSLEESMQQIPDEEIDDTTWPYNQTEDYYIIDR
jgi:hypothetical protein